MMKKFLAILLAMMLVLVNVAALAYYDADGNELYEEGDKYYTDAEKTNEYTETLYELVDGKLEPVKTETAAGTSTKPTGDAEDQTSVTPGGSAGTADAAPAPFTVPKSFEINAVANGRIPAYTPEFSASIDHVEDATDNDKAKASAPGLTVEAKDGGFSEGSTDNINLTFTFDKAFTTVGKYFYSISETKPASSIAGIQYLDDALELKVTVTQGTNGLVLGGIALRQTYADGVKKTDTIVDVYDAGSLTIEKTVTGNLGDLERSWPFTVELEAPEGTKVFSKLTVSGTGKVATTATGEAVTEIPAEASGWATKTLYVTLVSGQSIQIDNLPAGVIYTVTETEAASTDGKEKNDDGYTTVAVKDTDTIAKAATSEAKFTNDKTEDPDMGIELETLPFVLLMGIALVGVMALRRREDY